jgi:hypothetical protein
VRILTVPGLRAENKNPCAFKQLYHIGPSSLGQKCAESIELVGLSSISRHIFSFKGIKRL